MRVIKTIGIAAVVLVAAVLVYQVVVNNKHLPQTSTTAESVPDDSATPVVSPELAAPKELESASNAQPDINKPLESSPAESDQGTNAQLIPDYPPLAAYDIGHKPVEEDELIALVERLNNDPALMADLINELRAETDPERLKRLVYILGSTGNASVLPAAEEMIYSGIDSSRNTGLDLLSRVASKNPEAMTMANNLLVSETEPDVLLATINVLAQPANTTPELRESLVTQLTPLSSHESTAVRGFSIATLARLSNDPSLAPVFYNALYDNEPAVRSSGVYALASFPYRTPDADQKLMDMVEDDAEHIEVRRGAMLALSNNDPDELTQARIEAAQLAIRKKIRQQRLNGN